MVAGLELLFEVLQYLEKTFLPLFFRGILRQRACVRDAKGLGQHAADQKLVTVRICLSRVECCAFTEFHSHRGIDCLWKVRFQQMRLLVS